MTWQTRMHTSITLVLNALHTAVVGLVIAWGGSSMVDANLPIDHDSGVPRAVSDEIAAIFERAADDIVDYLRVPLDTEVRGEIFRRQRAASILQQIDRRLAVFNRSVVPLIERASVESYQLGLQQGQNQLTRMGVEPSADRVQRATGFDLVNARTVDVAARDIAAALANAIEDHASNAKRLLRAISSTDISDPDLTRTLAKHIVTGTPDEARREVREMFRKPGDQATYRQLGNRTIQVGKATMSVRHYANMLVRTRTREIVSEAKREEWLENDVRLAVITGKVTRYFCTRYIGLVVSLDGRSKEWPSVRALPGGGPPFHPNCSKGYRPFIPHLARPGEIEEAKRALTGVENVGLTSREHLEFGEQAAARQRL